MIYTTTFLASSGVIGHLGVPACPKCGGWTVRLDGSRRACEHCHAVCVIVVEKENWYVKLI